MVVKNKVVGHKIVITDIVEITEVTETYLQDSLVKRIFNVLKCDYYFKILTIFCLVWFAVNHSLGWALLSAFILGFICSVDFIKIMSEIYKD